MESSEELKTSTNIITIIVYLSMLLDNILLTVVVPIIPDFLFTVQNNTNYLSADNFDNITRKHNNEIGFKTPLQLEAELLENENGPVGLLLSSKAFIQLIANPIVGYLTSFWGYNIPLFIGNVNLLIATLLFTFGESYFSLFVARSLQGVASACISIAGLCLTARIHSSEDHRARIIGFVLGSVALGVLIGYPLGGVLYDFIGKSAPFTIIAALVFSTLGLQLWYMDLRFNPEVCETLVPTKWSDLLADPLISISTGAICISTLAMAVLEPCLPIWLMSHLNPHKWQLGTVFIPDSVGYLIGTNFFGVIAYSRGRWRVSIAAMLMIGVCAFIVPSATQVKHLMLPHFGLGLGIGIVDAALVPLLASLVDTRHQANYGSVYALQQISVSLAYCVGPLLGGQLVKSIGFPWVMRLIGIMNILFCPMLATLQRDKYCGTKNNNVNALLTQQSQNTTIYNSTSDNKHTNCNTPNYRRFYNSEE